MAGVEREGYYFGNPAGLPEQYDVVERRLRIKQKNVVRHFLEKMTKIMDSGDSVRAEVYNSLTEYVHRNESRLVELVEDLDEPTQNKILKSRDCFPTETNLENKMRKTTEYIMKNYAENEILGIIVELRIEAVIQKSEKLMWKAYELKRDVCCPGAKFQEEPDSSAADREVMKSFAFQFREGLRKGLGQEDAHVEVCYTLVKEFVMLTALKSKKISMQGESTKHDLRIWSCALHPKFPYLCVNGDLGADGEEILNILAKCHPSGEYQIAHDLKLMDEGLSAVYSSLLKVPSSVILETEEFRSRIPRPTVVSPMLPLPVNAAMAAKKRKERELNCLVNDGQSGGFKTLTLEYKQADCALPIICKMEALEGTLDENIAMLHENGDWTDPSPYLVAKDQKTNHLRLEHGGEKWVPSPAAPEEN